MWARALTTWHLFVYMCEGPLQSKRSLLSWKYHLVKIYYIYFVYVDWILKTARSLAAFATWQTNNGNHSEQFHISLIGAKCWRLGSDDVLMRLRSNIDGNQFDSQCLIASTTWSFIQPSKSWYHTMVFEWCSKAIVLLITVTTIKRQKGRPLNF